MLCQLFDTVNAGKYQKSKKIATDSNLIWDVMAFLTLLYFPLETTCSCKQDTKERYLGQQFWWSGKAHFGPTDRNDQTCHCRPPSKLVPNSLNIPVGPNRNGPFHLMNQPKFPEFWVKWKAPLKTTSTNGFNFRIINFIHLWYLAGNTWPGLTWDVQGCHKWSLVLLSSMYFPRLA